MPVAERLAVAELGVLGVLARLCAAWPPAWNAVIMVRRVIAEDRAGDHAPGMP